MCLVLNYFFFKKPRKRDLSDTDSSRLSTRSLCTFSHQVESCGVGRGEGLVAKGLDFSWKMRTRALPRQRLLP